MQKRQIAVLQITIVNPLHLLRFLLVSSIFFISLTL